MEKRNPFVVFFLSIITCGLYSIVWFSKTTDDMNRLGEEIPTVWLIAIPFLGFYWLWKFSQGVSSTTSGKFPTIVAFVLVLLFFPFVIPGSVGISFIQKEFNRYEF